MYPHTDLHINTSRHREKI